MVGLVDDHVHVVFKTKTTKKGRCLMDGYEEVLRALGRIEGELVEIRKLSARVRAIEAGVLIGYLCLCRLAFG